MIIYITAYVLMGLLAGLGVSIYGKVKRWDYDSNIILTLAGSVFWPALPFVVLVWYALIQLNKLSDIIVEKYRN